MTSYNPHYSDQTAYSGYDDWNEFLYYPNHDHAIGSITPIYFAHAQSNTDLDYLPTTAPPFPPPPVPPFHASPSSQTNIITNPFLSDDHPYYPPAAWAITLRHVPAQSVSSSAMLSAPTTAAPPMTLNAIPPTIASTSSVSQRSKFPCTYCGKMCTSRPRAYTCLLNHLGVKPFTCKGVLSATRQPKTLRFQGAPQPTLYATRRKGGYLS